MIISYCGRIKLKVALTFHSSNTWCDSTVILNSWVEHFHIALVLTEEHSPFVSKVVCYDWIFNVCVSLLIISEYYASSRYTVIRVKDRWENVEFAVSLKPEDWSNHWEIVAEITHGQIQNLRYLLVQLESWLHKDLSVVVHCECNIVKKHRHKSIKLSEDQVPTW